VAEGVRDPPEAPAVLLVHRRGDGGPGRGGALDEHVGVVDHEQHAGGRSRHRLGAEWRNAGVSSETQNDVPATDSWATIASSPTRYSSTAPNAAL
jgi:hypothetical protein